MTAMRSFTRGVLMMGALMLPVAAEFVPPAEGPVPFRRDKLPVDTDTMTALSRQVMVLARDSADPAKSPRAVAQMTALALALDPENREAKDLIESMKQAKAPQPVAGEDAERARNRTWQALAWLEMPEAGADAQALAACLSDVLVMADPKHPRAKDRRSAGEKGRWASWVADEAAFRPKDSGIEPEMADDEESESEPDSEDARKELAINELSSPMPMWFYDTESKRMKLGMVPVRMRVVSHEPDEKGKDHDGDDKDQAEPQQGRLLFELPGEGRTEQFAKAMREVEKAMNERHGSFPPGKSVKLDFGKADYSMSRNGMSVTGTTALLMEGAYTGKLPAASVLAVVGDEGKLELPPRFWQTLRALSAQAPGTRLILPDEAADYLTALVVMDDAAFFMTNEVILAGSVDELCDFASPTPEAELADGLKRFEEVRKVGQGKALGTFVSHQSTQQRLRELAGVMPEHASARMLALQGSGSRPRFLQRSILAREIRSALEPMDYLAVTHAEAMKTEELEEAHEASREKLDKLTGYIELRDRDLHKAATDVADSLRPLARILEKKSSEDGDSLMRKKGEACQAARLEYLRVLRDLADAAGDAEDFPPPILPKRD
jgi:hypothetical protein